MTGILAALRILRDEPDIVLNAIDTTWHIVSEEFERVRGQLKPGFLITRSVNAGGVEINYRTPGGTAPWVSRSSRMRIASRRAI